MRFSTSILLVMFLWYPGTTLYAADTRIAVLYLAIAQPQRATLSNLDPTPEDLGMQGANLALTDNNTTGSFMGYEFALETVKFDQGKTEEAKTLLQERDQNYVVLDMSASEMLALVDAVPDKLYFNVRAYDDNLRSEDCRSALFHSLPSYAMRADSLMQFLLRKRWDEIVLIEGNAPEDASFAEAIRRSAKKFRLDIEHDVKWIFDDDMRRSASSEVPLFSQQFEDYDAMLIADEHNDFARYIAYNSWQARPIFGADGLMVKGWSRVMEQWGAAQLQSRFRKLAGRDMRAVDYAAWAALRSVDEAIIRTKFGNAEAVRSYLLSDAFSLAGFKGRPLSFRNWNGQMRQPIGLVTASALVANAPLEGFLHKSNELDTIGLDRHETSCNAFKE